VKEGGGGEGEREREQVCTALQSHRVCLLLHYLLQRCSRGGRGETMEDMTCATRDYEPRPVWTNLPITH
jgi:hypothetical protein